MRHRRLASAFLTLIALGAFTGVAASSAPPDFEISPERAASGDRVTAEISGTATGDRYRITVAGREVAAGIDTSDRPGTRDRFTVPDLGDRARSVEVRAEVEHDGAEHVLTRSLAYRPAPAARPDDDDRSGGGSAGAPPSRSRGGRSRRGGTAPSAPAEEPAPAPAPDAGAASPDEGSTAAPAPSIAPPARPPAAPPATPEVTAADGPAPPRPERTFAPPLAASTTVPLRRASTTDASEAATAVLLLLALAALAGAAVWGVRRADAEPPAGALAVPPAAPPATSGVEAELDALLGAGAGNGARSAGGARTEPPVPLRG